MGPSTMKNEDTSKKLLGGKPISDDAFTRWRDSVPIIDVESDISNSSSEDDDDDDFEPPSSATPSTAAEDNMEALVNAFMSLAIEEEISSSSEDAASPIFMVTPPTDASSAPATTNTCTDNSRLEIPIISRKPSCVKVQLASPRPKGNPEEGEENQKAPAFTKTSSSAFPAPESTFIPPSRRRDPTPPPVSRKRKPSRDDDEDKHEVDAAEPRVKRIRFVLPTPSEACAEPLTIKLPPSRKLAAVSSPEANVALDSASKPRMRPILKSAPKVASTKQASSKEETQASGKKLRTVKLVVQKHQNAVTSIISRHNTKRLPPSHPDSPPLDLDNALDNLVDRLQQPQLVAADQRAKAIQIKQAFADYGKRLRRKEQRKELRRGIRQHQRLLVALLAYGRA